MAERPRHWWREVGTLVAVIGLLTTLVFNTVGVWRDVESGQDARDTAQISLMTQLNSAATESERRIDSTAAQTKRCRELPTGTLTEDEVAQLYAALSYYEYLAWLMNRRRITVRDADEYFGPDMLNAYEMGAALETRAAMREDFPELTRFRTRRASLVPPDGCPA